MNKHLPGRPTLNDPTFLGLLRLLAKSPTVTQRDMASSLGISLGKAHYCLRTLIDRALVVAQAYRKSDNRVAYRYTLTPEGRAAQADLTRRFLAHKVREHEELRAEIDQLRRESGEMLDDGIVSDAQGVYP